jgi:hypothetical protein
MKSPGLFYEPEEVETQANLSEENYIDQLHGIPVLEISGGVNFDEAAKAISLIINSEKI